MSMDAQTPVQPILVRVSPQASHEQVCVAVALASAGALRQARAGLFTEREIWNRWCNGSYTKSVRVPRGPSHWDRALDTSQHCLIDLGPVAAAAFEPVTYPDMTEPIRKARVSGLQRDTATGYLDYPQSRYTIWLADDLGMSTGKAAAQAAHAACAVASMEGPWSLRLAPSAQLADLDNPVAVIQDNGLTEIEPGSLTAVVA